MKKKKFRLTAYVTVEAEDKFDAQMQLSSLFGSLLDSGVGYEGDFKIEELDIDGEVSDGIHS